MGRGKIKGVLPRAMSAAESRSFGLTCGRRRARESQWHWRRAPVDVDTILGCNHRWWSLPVKTCHFPRVGVQMPRPRVVAAPACQVITSELSAVCLKKDDNWTRCQDPTLGSVSTFILHYLYCSPLASFILPSEFISDSWWYIQGKCCAVTKGNTVQGVVVVLSGTCCQETSVHMNTFWTLWLALCLKVLSIYLAPKMKWITAHTRRHTPRHADKEKSHLGVCS